MPEAPKNFDDIICGKVTEESKQAYNDEAFQEYNEKSLEPCPNCGRTFLPDRLVIHLRSCGGAKTKESPTKGSPVRGGAKKSPVRSSPKAGLGKAKSSGVPKTKISKPSSKGPGAMPPGIICYICGRKYGTKSIDIHIKQCIDLWEKTESKKPKKERRPVPQKPEKFEEMKISPMGSKAMDEYNDEAFKNYNEKALVPCDL